MKRFAVIGNPIKHSKSPQIFTYWFEQMKISAKYYHLELDKNIDVSTFKAYLQNLTGANITAPFKHLAYLMADKKDEIAQATQAVNTIINNNGILYGYNTDVYGVKYALTDIVFDRVLVLGAGKAATAAIYTLVLQRKKIGVFNRTMSNASKIINLYNYNNLSYIDKDDFNIFNPDLIINTIPDNQFVKSIVKNHLDLFANTYFLNAIYPMPSYVKLLNTNKYIRGEYWLIGQAISNFQLFTRKKLPSTLETKVFELILE